MCKVLDVDKYTKRSSKGYEGHTIQQTGHSRGHLTAWALRAATMPRVEVNL